VRQKALESSKTQVPNPVKNTMLKTLGPSALWKFEFWIYLGFVL
jgi:hypothetical protein